MSKRLTAFVPAALIGGVLLLTACGQAGPAANTSQSTSTKSTSTPSTPVKTDGVVSSSDEELEPVECGPVKVYETTYTLVADPTPAGIVGCTEAFNVVDEYLAALPVNGDVFQTVELPSGWTCSMDDGEYATIDCEDKQGLRLHTEPSGTEEGGGDDLTPVDCGPVEVNTGEHVLIADATGAGIVGCTEAFNVVDEYQNALPGEPGDVFQTITLPSGWTCGTDDGEFAAIECTNEEGLRLHTEEPVK